MDWKNHLAGNAFIILVMAAMEFTWLDFGIIHWSIALGIYNALWIYDEIFS